MNSAAVIYARYSSQGQREESIEGQLRECRIFAERNGFTIVREYTDSALTGRSDQRPAFQRMIRDAEKRQFSTVIVWKLDRFARNRYDSAMYRAKLKKAGVSIVSAREAIPDGAEGIIVESLMEGMAEYYSANLAENVRRGQYENALQRKTLGGFMPLGLQRGSDGKYAINEAEAVIVRRIFNEAAAGRSVASIVDDLNRDGFRNRNGSMFERQLVHRILKNEKYTGMYRFADIEDPEGIPPIVSPDLFRKANAARPRRRRSSSPEPSEHYLLSGKLFCGSCERLMTGEYAISKTGDRHYYYFCIGAKNHHCSAKRIRKSWIESIVIEQISALLDSPSFLEELTQLVLSGVDEDLQAQRAVIAERQAALADARRKYENMIRAIEEGLITPGLRERLLDLEELTASLEEEIRALQLDLHPITRDDIEQSLAELKRHRDQLDWQVLVDVFIDRIYYFPDHLLILLNYSGKDQRISVPLDDGSGGDSSNNGSGGQPFDTHSNPSLLWWFGCPALWVPLQGLHNCKIRAI